MGRGLARRILEGIRRRQEDSDLQMYATEPPGAMGEEGGERGLGGDSGDPDDQGAGQGDANPYAVYADDAEPIGDGYSMLQVVPDRQWWIFDESSKRPEVVIEAGHAPDPSGGWKSTSGLKVRGWHGGELSDTFASIDDAMAAALEALKSMKLGGVDEAVGDVARKVGSGAWQAAKKVGRGAKKAGEKVHQAVGQAVGQGIGSIERLASDSVWVVRKNPTTGEENRYDYTGHEDLAYKHADLYKKSGFHSYVVGGSVNESEFTIDESTPFNEDEWMSLDEMELECVECAGRMRDRKMTRILRREAEACVAKYGKKECGPAPDDEG